MNYGLGTVFEIELGGISVRVLDRSSPGTRSSLCVLDDVTRQELLHAVTSNSV